LVVEDHSDGREVAVRALAIPGRDSRRRDGRRRSPTPDPPPVLS
jgi:hypothetical protein